MDERLTTVKYINDPVYGGIAVTRMEIEIIDTSIFHCLRGLSEFIRIYVLDEKEHSCEYEKMTQAIKGLITS